MSASTTLYRKYRPQTFADVVGQKHIVQTLTNALKLGRVGQAYLLTGPRGTGKTTLARLFAKAVNCSDRKGSEPCGKCQHCLLMAEGRSLDIIEIDAASHTGVDNIRELRETINLPPTLGSHKIYIIDEVHMLSIGAFNALLKTLEEPPAHVIFILATTALHKVPDTIVSRCQRFDLSRFPVKSIVEKLEKIAKAEKLKISREALEMIAITAEGGMRDAESLLTQVASLEESPITEEKIVEVLGTTKKENIVALLRLIGRRELYPALSFVGSLSQDGADLAVFCGALLHYLRDLLLVSADPVQGPEELESLTGEQKAALIELANVFPPAEAVRMLEYFQTAQTSSKTAVIPELPIQIAIVKILTDNNKQVTGNSQQSTGNQGQETGSRQQVAGNKEQPASPETPKKTEINRQSTKNSQQKIAGVDGQGSPVTNYQLPVTSSDEDAAGFQETTLELSAVQDNWSKILDTAKRLNASLSLALSTARPIDTEGSTIVIAVKYPFHKERLDEPANRLTLKEAFDTILGSQTKLRIVLESAASEKEKKEQSNESFLSNPIVSQAMEMLGGKLVQEGQ